MKKKRGNTNLKERLSWQLLRWIPFSIMYGIVGEHLIIPVYHMVSDGEPIHTKHLYRHKGIRRFKEDLEFLRRHFKAISLSDLIDVTKGKKNLNEKCFLLTFDDGFREVYDIIAPILLQMGVPACFFIASAFIDNKELSYDHKKSLLADRVKKGLSLGEESEIEKILKTFGKYHNGIYESILRIEYKDKRHLDTIAAVVNVDFNEYLQQTKPYLTRDQISELIRKGFEVGAHSIDHPLYSKLSLEEQLRQTIESVRLIRYTFNIDYGAFAFPHSDSGVGAKFFELLNESGLVDITFGGRGFFPDEVRTNFQRLNFESPPFPAERLIKVEIEKKLWRIMRGRGTIRR